MIRYLYTPYTPQTRLPTVVRENQSKRWKSSLGLRKIQVQSPPGTISLFRKLMSVIIPAIFQALLWTNLLSLYFRNNLFSSYVLFACVATFPRANRFPHFDGPRKNQQSTTTPRVPLFFFSWSQFSYGNAHCAGSRGVVFLQPRLSAVCRSLEANQDIPVYSVSGINMTDYSFCCRQICYERYLSLSKKVEAWHEQSFLFNKTQNS